MKSKAISMLALIISAGAFFVSVAFLVYRLKNGMNFMPIIFQLIATFLIAVLCFFNVVYLFTSDDSNKTDDD